MLHAKQKYAFNKDEIEQFCQDTLAVLKKIHNRVDQEKSKKKQRKKKTIALVESK
jgi:hypothetical protein